MEGEWNMHHTPSAPQAHEQMPYPNQHAQQQVLQQIIIQQAPPQGSRNVRLHNLGQSNAYGCGSHMIAGVYQFDSIVPCELEEVGL